MTKMIMTFSLKALLQHGMLNLTLHHLGDLIMVKQLCNWFQMRYFQAGNQTMNLTLNPTLDFKCNIESRPLAPQATPQRNIPWSTQDSTFSSKTSSLLSSNSHLTHNVDEHASQVNRMFLRDEDDLTTHEKAWVEAQPI
jgi:hypothetical protein